MKKLMLLAMAMALVVVPGFSRGGDEVEGSKDTSGYSSFYAAAGKGDGSTMLLSGVLGNVIGMAAGGLLGSLLVRGGGESLLPSGLAPGALAGSVCGSALGVHLAAGRRGNFGSALAGSALGIVAAIAVTSVLSGRQGLGVLGIVSLAILPPLGAFMLYSRSMGSYSSRTSGGLFSLAGGKLGLRMPEVRVRPILVPGCVGKPEMQFNVNVLSVEL